MDAEGNTALHLAVRIQSVGVVTALLAESDIVIDPRCAPANVTLLSCLIFPSPQHRNNQGETPLVIAMTNGLSEIELALRSKGADQNLRLLWAVSLNSSIYVCFQSSFNFKRLNCGLCLPPQAHNNKVDVVQEMLIDRAPTAASVNMQDHVGNTALNVACRYLGEFFLQSHTTY